MRNGRYRHPLRTERMTTAKGKQDRRKLVQPRVDSWLSCYFSATHVGESLSKLAKVQQGAIH